MGYQKYYRIRALVVNAIREFFQNKGFLEVSTPTLVKTPDPSIYHEVFSVSSKHKGGYYLTPSPELSLKKLLAAGLSNIFEIAKAYRDLEEKSPHHLPEFTILEWYRSQADYLDLMTDCEKLIGFIQQKLNQPFSNAPPPPWLRISCEQAFKKFANVDLGDFCQPDQAKKITQDKGYPVSKEGSWEQLYHQIFLNEVEPQLTRNPAFFLYDYPLALAELAKPKEANSPWAERVELYLNGLEIGNGYSELTNWQEQEERLQAQIALRKKKKMRVFDYDHEFVEALKRGLPPTAGMAIGVDRLVMLFAGVSHLQQLTPFNTG